MNPLYINPTVPGSLCFDHWTRSLKHASLRHWPPATSCPTIKLCSETKLISCLETKGTEENVYPQKVPGLPQGHVMGSPWAHDGWLIWRWNMEEIKATERSWDGNHEGAWNKSCFQNFAQIRNRARDFNRLLCRYNHIQPLCPAVGHRARTRQPGTHAFNHQHSHFLSLPGGFLSQDILAPKDLFSHIHTISA